MTSSSKAQIDRLNVSLGERSYDILIGAGLIDSAGAEIKAILRRPRSFVVTDSNVARLYLEPFMTSLRQEGIAADSIILPAGEATKSFAVL
jgi:3-dehydroquinate synthase